MRISDWSSDVCSSDLLGLRRHFRGKAGMALLLQAAFILVGFCRILRAFQARIGLADEAAPVVAARFGLVRVHTLGERRGRSDAGGEDRKSTRLNSSH